MSIDVERMRELTDSVKARNARIHAAPEGIEVQWLRQTIRVLSKSMTTQQIRDTVEAILDEDHPPSS